MYVELKALRKLMKPIKGSPERKGYYKRLFKWYIKMIKAKDKIGYNLEGRLYQLRKDRKKGKVFFDGYTLAIAKLEFLSHKKFLVPQMLLLKEITESLQNYMEREYTSLYIFNGLSIFDDPYIDPEDDELEEEVFKEE